MSDQSRVFIGLLRPPKLMGLPIMYAMVWLFGSALLPTGRSGHAATS
jgi:type IV secretion system protein VirB3